MGKFESANNVFTAGVLTQSARVECFTNQNPMTAQKWPSAIQVNDVLVMTAQRFLNMLRQGIAQVSQFDLMVSFWLARLSQICIQQQAAIKLVKLHSACELHALLPNLHSCACQRKCCMCCGNKTVLCM